MSERKTVESILAELDTILIRAKMLTAETRELVAETRAVVEHGRQKIRRQYDSHVWTVWPTIEPTEASD